MPTISRPRPICRQKCGGMLAIGREILTVQNVFGKIFNVGTEFARDGSEFDRLFDDGDRFSIGGIPGHRACTCPATPRPTWPM